MRKVSFDLTGKVAVVVGGTTGIGRAIAEEFAAWGADTITTGRREEKCREAYEAIISEGVRSLILPTDATDRQQLIRLRDAVVKEFGKVDILVNAAGINRRHDAIEFPMEDFDEVMQINCRALFESCQVFGETMIQQGFGKIINIASMGSFFGLNRIVAYTGSKGAVLQMSKTLAVEWAKYNIQVNCIAPGYFKTELTTGLQEGGWEQKVAQRNPMNRWGQIDELLGAAVLLASDSSSYITGEAIVVDGGMSALGV